MRTEDEVEQRLAKAQEKLEKAEEEVSFWEELFKIATRTQQKLT